MSPEEAEAVKVRLEKYNSLMNDLRNIRKADQDIGEGKIEVAFGVTGEIQYRIIGTQNDTFSRVCWQDSFPDLGKEMMVAIKAIVGERIKAKEAELEKL